jgi:DNA-binding transcriptional regulator YiaG
MLSKTIKPAEAYRADYARAFAAKAAKMAELRKSRFVSQMEMARLSGCSERKIQSFEAGNCHDAYLLYVYKNQLGH